MGPTDPRRSLVALFAVSLTAIGACSAEDNPLPPANTAGAAHGGAGGVGSGGGAGKAGQGRGGTAGSSAGNAGTGDHAGAGTGGRATGGGSAGSGGSHSAGGRGGTGGDGGTDAGGAAGEAGLGGGGPAAGTANDGGAAGAVVVEPGGAGGEGGSAAEEGPVFVYVARLLGGVLSLSIDGATGAASELASSPTNSGRHLYATATEPARRFLYTADLDGGQLDAYRIALDGSIPKAPDSTVTIAQQPITLAVGGPGPFLYAGTLTDKSVHIFAIDADTGALDAAIPAFELEQEPAYLAVDPTGQFLYVSLEFEAGIRGFAIGGTGALTELEDSPFAETLVRSGALAFEPDGAFLFSAGNGLNAFSIEPTSGKLTAVEGSPFSLDLGSDFFATSLAVDPQGDFLYTTSFLSTRHVRGFRIDHASGALEEVPGSPVTTSSPYSVAVNPTGRFVLAGNDSGDTSVFLLHRADGKLEEVEHSPFPIGGLQPEFAFAATPGP